ncbi:putative heme/steroid binding domain protein [Aspergillus affinis]|uniref:putative heme/steroid binding domain protein n=1 Tax=Aspergillus affinis TaxID=1070780 RepID=UPI0022FE7C3E|nr:cytochrome b5 [Aspergillus affinis]KAI9044022.1 cytochrome b5 [Aspergillus affinis]
MSDLRQRNTKSAKPTAGNDSPAAPRRRNEAAASKAGGIGVLDILRLVLTLAVASCGLSYYMTSSESLLWGYRPWYTRVPVLMRYLQGPLYLTPAQLAPHDGSDPSIPIYLAVNGSIFDVSANPMIYGPGGHYNIFAGRDATRAFVTGCFQDDLTADMTGVEDMFIPIENDPEEEKTLSSGEKKTRREQDLRMARNQVHKQVQHWENFFRNHKKYFEVGKVVGLEDLPKETRELCEQAKQQRPKRKNLNKKKQKEQQKKQKQGN